MRPYNFDGINEMKPKKNSLKKFEKKKQIKLLPFDEFDEMNKRNRNGMKQIILFSSLLCIFIFHLHFPIVFVSVFVIENGKQKKNRFSFSVQQTIQNYKMNQLKY